MSLFQVPCCAGLGEVFLSRDWSNRYCWADFSVHRRHAGFKGVWQSLKNSMRASCYRVSFVFRPSGYISASSRRFLRLSWLYIGKFSFRPFDFYQWSFSSFYRSAGCCKSSVAKSKVASTGMALCCLTILAILVQTLVLLSFSLLKPLINALCNTGQRLLRKWRPMCHELVLR